MKRQPLSDRPKSREGVDTGERQPFDLVKGTASLELLRRLRGSVEFKDKKKMLAEIEALRRERRL